MRNLTFAERLSLLRSFVFDRRLLKETPYYSRDRMLAWQWERICKLVRHAYENVPFYAKYYRSASFHPNDLRSLEDFHRMPSVTKDQVIANFPERILATGVKLDQSVVSRSSGSSGKVLDIAYDDRAMITYMLAGLRLYKMGFDYRPWHRQLYIYTSRYPLNSLFGLYPLAFVSTLTPIPEIISQVKLRRPDLLVCYPSHLKQIEQQLSDSDLSRIALRCISVNSEMSTQAERDRLSERFGCPVLDEYSSEELTRIAAQCRCGTYHIFEDINYMETKLQGDGSSVLTGTNLHNYAMPMIRYEQNDLGRIEERPCDCGWSFRALVDLQGPKNDSFIMPSGKTISSGFLLDATYEVLLTYRTAVKDFCLIQTSRNDVVLEVVTGDGWSADVRRAIEARFTGFFEPGMHFSITPVELCSKTKSGKRNPIISRIENGDKFSS
jgi:phenylacetate-CoA ligase